MRRISFFDTLTRRRGGVWVLVRLLRVAFTCTKKKGVFSPASSSSTKKSNVSHFSPRKCGQKYGEFASGRQMRVRRAKAIASPLPPIKSVITIGVPGPNHTQTKYRIQVILQEGEKGCILRPKRCLNNEAGQ